MTPNLPKHAAVLQPPLKARRIHHHPRPHSGTSPIGLVLFYLEAHLESRSVAKAVPKQEHVVPFFIDGTSYSAVRSVEA